MVSEGGVDDWEHRDRCWHATDAAEEVYGRFERAREETCTVEPVSDSVAEGSFKKRRFYPVRNRFPMLAPEKSKREDGRSLLTISIFIELRKLRISSFLGEEMLCQMLCWASIMSSHSCRALRQSFGRRWLKSSLIAPASELGSPLSGMRRTSLPEGQLSARHLWPRALCFSRLLQAGIYAIRWGPKNEI